jgi:hypothetical protein
MPQGFFRCSHCRGFYEIEKFDECKWCHYETVIRDTTGQPIVFPDRETVRAIQITEFKQLPPKAFDDCFQPPIERPDMICQCLHCGPDGHLFEAIEMRWMATENMWACPCTTCGGRGFNFDIHPVEPLWQCSDCRHWYKPEKFTPDHALCPKCGSTMADGWFEFEDDDEEFDSDSEPFDYESSESDDADPPPAYPFKTDPSKIDWTEETRPWYPGKDDEDEEEADGEYMMPEEILPDDIDFPRHRSDDDPAHGPRSDEDIPF